MRAYFRLVIVILVLLCWKPQSCPAFRSDSNVSWGRIALPHSPRTRAQAARGNPSIPGADTVPQSTTSRTLIIIPDLRRDVLKSIFSSICGLMSAVILTDSEPHLEASAEEEPPMSPPAAVEMKEFVDPKGLFSLRIPKYYFAIRREVKGDLPDPKTGEGRRGSSIFTAGDMTKAELVAVERFPTRNLLEENGIQPTGDLSTFTSLGEPAAIANLLSMRRDRDKAGGRGMSNTQLIPGSIYLTSDGKELSFQLKTEIEVQKPDLLLEQTGVSELYRVTTAKASLRSNDGNLMAVYGSALETDFNGPDGAILQEAVNSFRVNDLSKASVR